jgi:hypothetical protein
MENTFNLKQFLSEGILLKEEETQLGSNNIEDFIESEEEIGDIRGDRRVVRINFTKDIYDNEGEDEEMEKLEDAAADYIYSKYPDATELDWRDSSEVEVNF